MTLAGTVIVKLALPEFELVVPVANEARAAWTFSVWIQPESQALAGLAALYTEGVPQLTFSIYLASGAVQVFSYNQAAVPPAVASATLGSGPVVVPNIWQHVAITFAATNEFAGTCSIYVGGTNVATGSLRRCHLREGSSRTGEFLRTGGAVHAA